MSDPLDKFFDVNSNGELFETNESGVSDGLHIRKPQGSEDASEECDEILDIKVEIPDNVTLSDVTKLALDAYKQQIDILKFIEPKYRNRGFEVAESYLRLARDSIKQDVELSQKAKKLNIDNEESVEKKSTNSRAELYEITKRIKNQ